MATAVQLRRGSTGQISSFTGLLGECVVNTTTKTLVVNDGETAGGIPLARADFDNISASATLTLGTLSATQVDITAQGDLRLQDTTGGEYAALQAPGTVSASYTLTMPSAVGASGQALRASDGSGSLEWYTPADVGDITSVVAGAGLTGGGTSGAVTLNAIGTADRVSVSADAIDIDSGYVGQTSITTLGTVASGTWQASIIADAYINDALTISGGTIDNSVIGGTTPAAITATQVDITATGDLRLQDTSGGEYAALQAPGTVSASYTLTMPGAVGSSGQALRASDGAGALEWFTPADVGDITSVVAGAGLTGGGTSGDVTLNAIGTADRITVSADAIDIASGYVGQATITTVGTIASGTWQGTAVAKTYVSGSPSGDYVGTSDSQTLTNKTLTTPVIGTISNTGSLTLPTSTDTLVGRATTDTLTNKTLTSPVLNGSLSGTGFLDENDLVSNSQVAAASQASIKTYVDSVASGLDLLDSVHAASTAALTVTYSNGSSGVGATLTNAGTQAALVIDGQTLVATERVLIKDQAAALQNGIYTVTNVGSGSSNWVLTRSTDFDTGAELDSGSFVFVETGTSNADSGWVMTTDGTITIGTTSINWTQFSKAADILAGDGLTKTGSTIDAIGTSNRISVNGNIDIDAAYVGQASITTVGTIGSGIWQGTAIADTYVTDALTISGGTINNTVIGGSTAAAVSATTLTTSSTLTVGGTTTITGTDDTPLLINTANANGPHLRFQVDGSSKHFVGSGGGVALGDADDLAARAFDNLLFATGNSSTERLRIDSSGRVGVGGAANINWRNDATDDVLMLGSEATLHSDAGVTTELWNNALVNNDDTFVNISGGRGATRYFQYNGEHKWYTAASASAGSTITSEIQTTPKMTLDVTGKVHIGTSGVALLNVNAADGVMDEQYVARFANNEATAGRNYGVFVAGGSNSSDESFSVRPYTNTSTLYLKVRGDGNVGIGGDPSNKLEIRGASTVGTINGHIMLTGDSATTGQGPQIVFSESGNSSNWVGASIGFERTGGSGIGNLLIGTRATAGDANTVATTALTIDSSQKATFGGAIQVNGTTGIYNGLSGDIGGISISPSNTNTIISNNSPGSYGDYGMLFRTMKTTGGAAYVDALTLNYDGEIRVAGQTAVKGSNSKYGMVFPDNSGIAIGSAYTFGNIYGSSGNIFIRANSYVANTGSNGKVHFQTANSSGGQANDVVIDGGTVLIGHGTDTAISGESNELQVYDTNFSLASFATFRDGSDGATLSLAHSRSGTIGTQTVLSDGDTMGAINFIGSDGTDMATAGAAIRVQVDGTPGSNDMPGRFVFLTTADGASTPTERFRISQDGSLSTSTLGTSNVRFGVHAGNSIASGGNYNVLIGDEAGDLINTGGYNVALGYAALSTDDVGNHSTAIGYGALNAQNFASNTDAYNTAVGSKAGESVSTGYYNTLIGGLTGDALTVGIENVAIGVSALGADLNGSGNVAIGAYALTSQEASGTAANNYYNVAIGRSAGLNVSDGYYNTFIGGLAGDTCSNGTNNTTLGYNADVGGGGAVGRIAIGAQVVNSIDQTIAVGYGANTANLDLDGSDTDWAASSDERLKENIVSSTAGLSFINDLRPVTYNWKKAKDVPSELPQYVEGSDDPCLGHEYGTELHGFVAQEVKTVLDNHPEVKKGQSIWSAIEETTVQTLAPGALVPMLVKAVQELSAEVTKLKGE